MPTYDYRCKACQHEFEKFQSITADPLTECPECGGEVKRLISAGAGIIFRGSGFYETDYRSADYQAKAKADSEPVAEKPTGGESKTTPTSKSSDD